jgi:predicted nuclease with TOPRIM domain
MEGDMMDIVERLRQQLAEKVELNNQLADYLGDAEIALVECNKEVETAYEERAMAYRELAESQAKYKTYYDAWVEQEKRINTAERALVESQAREKILRDEFAKFHKTVNQTDPTRFQRSLGRADKALAMPSDSTALGSAIRQAKREALLEHEPEDNSIFIHIFLLALVITAIGIALGLASGYLGGFMK